MGCTGSKDAAEPEIAYNQSGRASTSSVKASNSPVKTPNASIRASTSSVKASNAPVKTPNASIRSFNSPVKTPTASIRTSTSSVAANCDGTSSIRSKTPSYTSSEYYDMFHCPDFIGEIDLPPGELKRRLDASLLRRLTPSPPVNEIYMPPRRNPSFDILPNKQVIFHKDFSKNLCNEMFPEGFDPNTI